MNKVEFFFKVKSASLSGVELQCQDRKPQKMRCDANVFSMLMAMPLRYGIICATQLFFFVTKSQNLKWNLKSDPPFRHLLPCAPPSFKLLLSPPQSRGENLSDVPIRERPLTLLPCPPPPSRSQWEPPCHAPSPGLRCQ